MFPARTEGKPRPLNRTLFDIAAGYYDFTAGQLPRWQEHCRSVATHLASDTKAVLDLGSGPGVSAYELSGEVPGLRIIGTDFSKKMIQRAVRNRERYPTAAQSLSWMRSDAVHLPVRSSSVDAVTGHSFLYLVPQRERVLSEVVRVLRPGGRAIFLEPRAEGRTIPSGRTWLRDPWFAWTMFMWSLVGRWDGRFTADELRSCLERSGLQVIRCDSQLDGFGWLAVALKPRTGSAAENASALPEQDTRSA